MRLMKNLDLYSDAIMALPFSGYHWTVEQARQAHDMAQATPLFLRERRLSELAPEVTSQRLSKLAPLRTIGEWLDAPLPDLLGPNGNRTSAVQAVAMALDRLRDATPETYVDGTPWPVFRRYRILLSMSRGMVLVRTPPGDRVGWIMRRPVIDYRGVMATARDRAYYRLAGHDADHVYLEKALKGLGLFESLAGDVEAVWLNADGVREACDLYGRIDSDHSYLRIGPPSWATRRS